MERRKRVRLLVVDEQREYFERIRDCAELCRHQFEVVCEFSDSGAEALKRIRTWHPEVVVIDAHIPDMNSLDLVESFKETETSIIVASDSASTEISQSAKEHGACGYVSKTEDYEEIEAFLQQLTQMAPEEITEVH